MNGLKLSSNILWVRVWVLAGLQAAITLCWLVYHAYLPQLLVQFGFPPSLAVSLLVIENALSVILEPLMGGLSEQNQRWVGSRFLFISAGVILSATLLIAIPCIVTFVEPKSVWRSLLPITLVAWALAMTIFRSPAMALLNKYSTPAELPLAFSVVTLAGGIVGAFRPIANKFILSLGSIFAFLIASLVLLATAYVLRLVNYQDPPVDEYPKKTVSLPWFKLSLILTTGFSVGWGSRLLMGVLSQILLTQFPGNDWLMVWVGLAIAIASLPAGWLSVKIGDRQAMLLGIGITLISLLVMVFVSLQVPFLCLLIFGFSLIINGTIPFAFKLVSRPWEGLAIGTYFGGFALAMSIFGAIFLQPQAITPIAGTLGATLAFLLTGGCIFAGGNTK
ncbi:MFS transporter [Nostoc sp. TCL26-01]|uniref:MFS transporter n=1 Tax=Nostoc sp. TCL26-01 TaxID=2576904 RepID=UPI0015B9A152|nr:MFS transporter [Nostoc sp. TCL26-01]QLE59306.1 SLC45 family MFS transporter [Nostoc sp. TCL26-01]